MAGSLSNTGAGLIFVAVLLAYTLQTELAQYLQQTAGYRKPYFLFYLTHSGYLLIAPLHLVSLRLLSIPIEANLRTLVAILEAHFAPLEPTTPTTLILPPPSHRPSYSRSLSRASLPPSADEAPSRPGPGRRRTSMKRLLHSSKPRGPSAGWISRLISTVLLLTFLIAFPALSWYAAVPLTSMTDITAIYNVFAFWAYLLAIKFLGEEPSKSKLISVLIAVSGVMVIAYGDSFSSQPTHDPKEEEKASSRLLGILLALFGSVWYKLHVALPDPEGVDNEAIEDEVEAEEEGEALLPAAETADDDTPYPPPLRRIISHTLSISAPSTTPLSNPSTTSFLLYSNLITALIGFFTLVLFWIPIPILHYCGWELFVPPPRVTWLPILATVICGVIFNAGFMLLLSLWGPVIASVGNLCTLVLVALADTLVPTAPRLSTASLLGSGLIVASFAGLIIGAAKAPSEGGLDEEVDERGRTKDVEEAV
ncbi:BQ2448_7935 [Microbotryum intermedium]|uniref:BQ2448_7935 protein n=1 Tax=Microbotryum intermedium TaxID=269621 RepID=A0A238FV19_9BASI|nr:BQ2448_7935 [Microbotryum intermedium]